MARMPHPGQSMIRNKLFPQPSMRVKNSNSIFFLSLLACVLSHVAHAARLKSRMEWYAMILVTCNITMDAHWLKRKSPNVDRKAWRRRAQSARAKSRSQWLARRRAGTRVASTRDLRRETVAGFIVGMLIIAPVVVGKGKSRFTVPNPAGAVVLSSRAVAAEPPPSSPPLMIAIDLVSRLACGEGGFMPKVVPSETWRQRHCLGQDDMHGGDWVIWVREKGVWMVLGSLHSHPPLCRYEVSEFIPSPFKNPRGPWPTLDETKA